MLDDATKGVNRSLSQHALILWGKTGPQDTELWLPLYVHLADTAAIAEVLWSEWVPLGTKRVIAEGIIELPSELPLEFPPLTLKERIELAGMLFALLATQHDIGKAIPAFQAAFNSQFRGRNGSMLAGFVESAGLRIPSKLRSYSDVHHSWASHCILARHGWSDSHAIITGAHHGMPPSLTKLDEVASTWTGNTGFTDSAWTAVQDELALWAESLLPVDTLLVLKKARLSRRAQVLLTALLIMADWIASDEKLFPLIEIGHQAEPSTMRALRAWENLDLSTYERIELEHVVDNYNDIYDKRFSIEMPRPVQTAIPEILAGIENPGIMIIEAPMGEGKTEAALVAAEILAEKSGRKGIFFALPTQATSDGVFPRILNWTQKLKGHKTINLVHGKAQFNKEFKGIGLASTNFDENFDEIADTVYVSEWAYGRKRALLNDFVVGTIDQVLMAGLKQRHLMLRHLGLANKVVIIDECHAYDAYMSQYLYKALNWLGSYQVPVVVLSATLPIDSRQALVDAYLNQETIPFEDPLLDTNKDASTAPTWALTTAYPLITYTADKQVESATPTASGRNLTVKIKQLSEQDIRSSISELLAEGGCIGIIVNTVSRAQSLACELAEHFGEETVLLLHSRFIAPDRIRKEMRLRELLGPEGTSRPEILIVVGTQVLEQSLDIDFDVMITDICPMDLLIQRIGRLHRHARRMRPPLLKEAKCYVASIEGNGEFFKGSELIYGKYMLMNTQALLPESIVLPDDIPQLVQSAYNKDGVGVASDIQSQYDDAKLKYKEKNDEDAKKAQEYQIGDPADGEHSSTATIANWLNTDNSEKDPSGKRAEATMRDGTDSVHILLIQELQDGVFYFLPWGDEYAACEIPDNLCSNNKMAQAVAKSSVTLPVSMSWQIDGVIKALGKDNLERLPNNWQKSPWLKGELFLILNKDLEAELCGFKVHYDERLGLCHEKLQRKDGEV
ncbi:MAG: CRISPR-associated helicase Cas3' [Coriobacteriia bacterium]|nr:CRISPR-associated helicase Cas3' [Coriobacteriia bacterium]